MVYDGTEGSISTNTLLRERTGEIIQRTHPTITDQDNYSGWNQYVGAQHTLLVQSPCGATVEADVTFRAAVRWITLDVVDEQKTGRSPSTIQPECAPCPAGKQPARSEAQGGSDAHGLPGIHV